MKYMDIIARHYNCFSYFTYNQIIGENRTVIHITGRMNFLIVILWVILSIIMFASSISKSDDNIGIYAIIDLIVGIIVIVKAKLVYRKLEHKPININLYQRDLPSNLRPAQVRLLVNDGLVDEKSLASTIVDLIDRGYLTINRKEADIKNKINLSMDRDIIIEKTDKPTDKLLRYEKFVIRWLIEKYGDGKKVTADVMMKKLQNNVYKEEPCDLFECWQGLVYLSFPIKRFYKISKIGYLRLIYVIFSFLGFIPTIPIFAAIGIYSLGCLLFAAPLSVLSDEGVEEKDKWLDLKRYLEDFSNIEQNTTEMVSIWQFYLTYSIALGIESISSKEIEALFGNNIYNKFEGNYDKRNIEANEVYIIEEVKDENTLVKEIEEEINKIK